MITYECGIGNDENGVWTARGEGVDLECKVCKVSNCKRCRDNSYEHCEDAADGYYIVNGGLQTEAIQCSTPPPGLALLFATTECSGTTAYDGTCTATCMDGYFGADVAYKCVEGDNGAGKWTSAEEPNCQAITCSSPPPGLALLFATTECSGTTAYDGICTATCMD